MWRRLSPCDEETALGAKTLASILPEGRVSPPGGAVGLDPAAGSGTGDSALAHPDVIGPNWRGEVGSERHGSVAPHRHRERGQVEVPGVLATTRRPGDTQGRSSPEIDQRELMDRIREILNRRPAVGLAVGVVRDRRLELFHGHGVADIASRAPITEDTVFRIASITKTFTAIAVMQLWEEGLVDLDAPANDYLRAYRLISAEAGFRPATVRHLLTHTAGIPDVVHASDLLHPGWGRFDARPAAYGVRVGRPLPTLADYYRGGLRSVVEPGTAFAYTNHGFATLGQIVEDVSGSSLDRYLREHIFEPLGMTDTSVIRSDVPQSCLAIGYDIGPTGAKAVTDREWVTTGASSIYSTPRDAGRFVVALLGGGANEHGSMLRPATVATMFEPHYQPDPRLPGMGLGFFRGDIGGHRIVGHDGRLPGFNSQLLLAPDDGAGVFAFTNGATGAFTWLPTELGRLLNHVLDVPDQVVRGDVPHHPEIWGDICGRYQLPPRVTDVRARLMTGAGAEVFVRDGRLMVRLLSPVPALYRGVPLDPDDDRDPYAFRIDPSKFGMPTVRVVFNGDAGVGPKAAHTDLAMLSLSQRPVTTRARASVTRTVVALLVAATAIAIRRRRVPVRRHAAT
jgi:CubicO group peptidase (beta-lactamase class C family)